jgi:hypothetical protein
MTNVTLGTQFATVILNGSGNGTVKLGPISAREVWNPANAHVSANANPINEAQCSIYVGDTVMPNNFRDGTFSGSSGDSTDKIGADIVKMGHYIWAVWTGGDAGQIATLSVTGTRDI